MPDYQYLIIGGGMTGDSAVTGIREVDTTGSIGLIGNETDKPYNRPPLTKQLWKGKPFDSVWRGTDDAQVKFHLGREAVALDPDKKQVTDDQGTVYTYDKLLLATGGIPRRLPFGDDHILYYRYLEDYRYLRALTEKHQQFAVIGSGFIGSEIGAALSMNGKKVTMVFPGEYIGERMFPPDLAAYVTGTYRNKGVEICSGEEVTELENDDARLTLRTRAGKTISAEAVVAGIGIRPNTDLAEAAGLKIEDGIVVNEYLRTSVQDIYAAGDVAAFHNPALNRRLRVEHEDNANTMGKTAGQNMAGKPVPYDYLPFFYSDLFELGYEAVGELDSRLEMVADWQTTHEKGVIYYLQEGRVRGVLLWNVWDQVPEARQLISQPGPFTANDLKGRIPPG